MIENGMLIAGRYQVMDKIGTGGMSDVYKALDTSLGREVALKILKDEYVTDMAFVSKFRAEAQSAAGLEHSNIVNVYDVGNEDGRYFIVMEFVEGITLKTYIAKKGHLSYNELLSIAIQVGRGIEAAHNKNIIHRDIKPQNIIISKEGKVKVTDFGIARAVTSNTINADRMGSVHYSSPEQARNGYVTFQSDIYSLGIVMYEMCTGRVPYDGDTTVAVAIQHLQSEMTLPSLLVPDVPVSVEKIILRATMKNPERRYSSMTEMLTDLKKALVDPYDDFVYIPPAGVVGGGDDPLPVIQKPDLEDIPKAPIKQRPDKGTTAPEKELEDSEEDEDDEDKISRGMDKAVTIMGIAAALVIIAIVIYLFGSFFGFFKFGKSPDKEPNVSQSTSSSLSSEDGELVKAPSVLGKDEVEAKSIIEDAGFTYKKLGEASSAEYDAGQIMEQSVNPGEMLEKGSLITVVVSSGEGSIPVPSVEGKTQEEANRLITGAGFAPNAIQEYSSDVPQGSVIRQSPAGNDKANKGDIINIWVSRGNEVIAVPPVAGMNQTEATNTLTRAGFKVIVEHEESASIPEDVVIRQNPNGQAQKGSEITIYISDGAPQEFFHGSISVGPIEDQPVYVVIKDNDGNVLAEQLVTRSVTIELSNLPSAEAVIYYYNADDKTTEIATKEYITFSPQ